MQCPSCTLRYNLDSRVPKLLPCAHSVCSTCLKQNNCCFLCLQPTPLHQNFKTNHSLVELLSKTNNEVDKYIKICFIGSSGVGKTSIIKRLSGKEFVQEISTTIGYDFSFQDRTVDGNLVRFQLWDSAGQEKFQAISPIHYKNADLVVLVYDFSRPSQENKLDYWLDQARKHCNQKVKKIFVGNKLDLVDNSTIIKPMSEHMKDLLEESEIELFRTCEFSCKESETLNQLWDIFDEEFKRELIDHKLKSKKERSARLSRLTHQEERVKKVISIREGRYCKRRERDSGCCLP